jgi:GDP-4-dehydro-6-deoxy-D-mannose reductase
LSYGNIPRAPLPAELSARLSTGFAYEQIDILDFNSIRDAIMHFLPEVVFHLGTGHRYSHMQHIVATNTVGTMNLVEALAAVRDVKPRLILVSSGGVYGHLRPEQLPVHESTRCEPCDVYSSSKFCSERLARLAGGQHAFSVIVARAFNVCGPGQDDTHVVGRFAAQLSANVPILRTRSLSATRDFIDVRDVAKALVHLASFTGQECTVNVGRGVETPVGEVLATMIRLSGFSGQVEIDPHGAGGPDIPRHVADISQLRAMGFEAKIDLESSLADVLSYYRWCGNIDTGQRSY